MAVRRPSVRILGRISSQVRPMPRMFLMSVRGSSRATILSEEGHEPQPEHIEGGQQRGDNSDQPINPAHLVGAPQNFILAEEAGEWRNSCDGNGCKSHGPERPWN